MLPTCAVFCFLISPGVLAQFGLGSRVMFFDADYVDAGACESYGSECIRMSNCPSMIERLRTGRAPIMCGFVGNTPEPRVCCPKSQPVVRPVKPPKPTKPSKPYEKARKKCEEYHKRKGPNIEPTVINGVPSLAREFPHMAALGYGPSNSIKWLCGGTLISEDYVVTAAHCTGNIEFGNVQYVRVGDLDLSTDKDKAQPQTLKVEQIIRHPDYTPSARYNDIALLKLSGRAEFTKYVKPACLPTPAETLYDFQELTLTGWGRTAFGGSGSDHLLKVDLEVFPTDSCKRIYKPNSDRKLKEGLNDRTQFCAGGANQEEKDACQGDSGGPLSTKKGISHYVYGITSFGKGCGVSGVPGVYTKVSYYVPWIENVVWK